jgi:hypothetical protein
VSGYRTGASEFRRGAGAAALIGMGVLHVFKTPEYLDAQLYVGVLFGLSFPLCIGLAAWLSIEDDRRAWTAGAMIAAAMVGAFLISRTVGLPGLDSGSRLTHWLEGFPALCAELGFLVLAYRPLTAPTPTPIAIPRPTTRRDQLASG